MPLIIHNKNGNLFLIRFDQICPNWIKLDQIWSFFRIPSLFLKFSTFSTLFTFYKFLIFFNNLLALDTRNSNLFLIRSVQNESNLIKFGFLTYQYIQWSLVGSLQPIVTATIEIIVIQPIIQSYRLIFGSALQLNFLFVIIFQWLSNKHLLSL